LTEVVSIWEEIAPDCAQAETLDDLENLIQILTENHGMAWDSDLFQIILEQPIVRATVTEIAGSFASRDKSLSKTDWADSLLGNVFLALPGFRFPPNYKFAKAFRGLVFNCGRRFYQNFVRGRNGAYNTVANTELVIGAEKTVEHVIADCRWKELDRTVREVAEEFKDWKRDIILLSLDMPLLKQKEIAEYLGRDPAQVCRVLSEFEERAKSAIACLLEIIG
jgi:hypothetical protein